MSPRFSARLAIFIATVAVLCYSRRVVEDDDCRPVARRFNDVLKTRDDQIVHAKKRLGELFALSRVEITQNCRLRNNHNDALSVLL